MTMVPLGSICRFEYGKSLPDKARKPGSVDVYGSNGPVGNHDTSFTSGRTIIIGRKGSIGEIHVSNQSCWPIDTTYFIDDSATKCDIDWLAFVLRYLNLGALNKASGVPGLNRDDAYKQLVPFPKNQKEQREIAALLKAQLAEVETARQAAQAQLSDARLLRARMLKAFFAELDTAPKKRLGDHAPTTSGSTPSRGNKRYWEPAEIAWVKTGEVAFAPITATEEAISKLALAECSLTLLPPKTILIAMYGQGKTRGQSAILEIPATTNQACFAILPNETWDPDFLYLWFKASYQDLREMSEDRGGNQANLNGALLKALDIPAPTKTEQTKLVARIQAAMTELDAIEQSSKEALADIEKLPARILAQAFENE
ncbi:restriction endonuclease subunit S [Vibrio cholerae]|uniref:restriction endonuclease subunit S n=2 Tax=Vibrio cholerae TaxID=666 RepID=UPI000851F676|nr:restriction endonuclease subunit S [Vibrio cholerae]EGR0659252.1 restriction endonuclease subunit S [Vibrio cholerae]EGR1116885.1 restriction endonuclease subunit S [Vibrio cholerae]EGR5154963.1 restriction endonuclease subunit S [Vibrio cholerae]EIC9844988.1 restriction endonuclease subunit S [Vibrio cholerae]EJL6299599.1 restriction endonuclease subunit S [Vibrio cholerae]